MTNPFAEFAACSGEQREIPLDRILRAKKRTMDDLCQGYMKLMEAEIRDLVWLVEHSRVVKAYAAALETIKTLDYDVDDIDEFCLELDRGRQLPYLVAGPADDGPANVSICYRTARCQRAIETERTASVRFVQAIQPDSPTSKLVGV